MSNKNKGILLEMQRLHELGCALHWIRPESKIPVNTGWNTGDRSSLEYLSKTHRDKYNLGVRLGPVSKVGDGYLGVIDLDIKSSNPKHRIEAEKTLKALLPSISDNCPRDESGRGNGSGHIFFKIKDLALKGKKIASSEELVKVYIPSVDPSLRDKKLLSDEELNNGMRLRVAWEIDVLLIGKQVVLPPSVHPDTKKRYKWINILKNNSDLPDLTSDLNKIIGTETEIKEISFSTMEDFHAVEVDIKNSHLSEQMKSLILNGEGMSIDRSTSLLTVALAMCRSGFNNSEILSVLTDNSLEVGQVSFEHAKSSSRKKAAEWISKYTLKKARVETHPYYVFDCPVDNLKLSADEAQAQHNELMSLQHKDWKEKLDATSNGKRKNTLKNIRTIIQKVVGRRVFKKDQFSNKVMYGEVPPWNKRKIDDPITDEDITNIIFWFSEKWGIEPREVDVNLMVTQIASENQFHPVRDYLNGLVWDGIERIDTFLKKYLNAKGPVKYLKAISRKFLCAMVARVMEPGIKFDTILILEGQQGIGKSTAASILGGPWFSDPSIVIGEKDSIQALIGKWIVEMGELSGLNKADVEKFKAYISCSEDDVRLPYGKRFEKYPRQSVFIGTTNSNEYLKDMSGNRRFWPVEVHKCDAEALKNDRDQLFAEALFVWNLGTEKLFLNEEESELAKKEQDKRVFHDPIEDEIIKLLSSEDNIGFNPKEFTMAQLLRGLHSDSSRMDINGSRRVGAILRKRGYVVRSSNGNNLWSLKAH